MPASVSAYAAGCPCVACSRVGRPAATGRLSRLLAMVDAIPSFEPCSSARTWRRLPKITSRGTSIHHGSPRTAMAALIAHPDLGGR